MTTAHTEHTAKPPHLKLVVAMAYPVGNRQSKHLVKLRCVAGTAFKAATGCDTAPDLTAAQIIYGGMRPDDRAASGHRRWPGL